LIQGLDIELSPHLLKQLVAVFDVDESGSIDFDEFRRVMMSEESWDLIAQETAVTALAQGASDTTHEAERDRRWRAPTTDAVSSTVVVSSHPHPGSNLDLG
jgi:hypothetical protein